MDILYAAANRILPGSTGKARAHCGGWRLSQRSAPPVVARKQRERFQPLPVVSTRSTANSRPSPETGATFGNAAISSVYNKVWLAGQLSWQGKAAGTAIAGAVCNREAVCNKGDSADFLNGWQAEKHTLTRNLASTGIDMYALSQLVLNSCLQDIPTSLFSCPAQGSHAGQ